MTSGLYGWATCPRCGRPLSRFVVRRTSDGYVCGKRHRRPCARLEDLRWMLATGESWPVCATRLGLTDEALQRWLYRHAPELMLGQGYARNWSRRRREQKARAAA